MPRKSKPYTEERKLKTKLGAVNSSNKAQLKKIEKLVITQEIEQVPLSKFYVYMNKSWHYKGMSCGLCNLLLTDPTVIDKHRYICNVNLQKMKVNGLD